MKDNSLRIFINYASKDNQAIGNKQGWVESFSYVLKMMIGQILKASPEIVLREDNANSVPADIMAFINVFSLDFKNDTQANDVLGKFIDSGGTDTEYFAVVKSPYAEGSTIPNAYEFFSTTSTGETDTWDPELEAEHSKDYWLKVVDLSYDISKTLHKEKPSFTKNVFLADVNPEEQMVRDAIRRDLKRHGYQTLPTAHLSGNRKEVEKTVIENLEKSELAIHFLGDFYGAKVPDSELSLVDLQNKLAAQYCKQNPGKMNRIIWLSPDHKSTDIRQSEFLDNLKKNKEDLASAELIQTPVELLKSIVLDYLQDTGTSFQGSKEKSSKEVEPVEDGGIYIIHDAADSKDVKSLLAWFEKNKMTVHTPDFELQHYKLMVDHKQKLVKADSVLIYCNNGNLQWSKTKMKDIIKAPGFGRKRPFEFKAIYIASQQNLSLKDQLEDSDFITLENTNEFSSSLMSSILQKAT